MNYYTDCRYDHGYDDEKHDRYFEVRIDFEFEPGYMDRDERGEHWVPGEIHVNEVYVTMVEYYNPQGEVIARMERHKMPFQTRMMLDYEADAYIREEVDTYDVLAEDMTRQYS